MEDMSAHNDDLVSRQTAALGRLLQEHKGEEVVLMDLRGIIDWTDFFLIATITSKTHMEGLERLIKEFCMENNLEIIGHSRKEEDNQWRLIDLGWAVIHLMNKNAREFYDLERLWRKIV
jgi:ribosome-associated protein